MPRDLLHLSGASGPVEIGRDQAGVVYITAADLADAHLGLGYCHAMDRGLQMLLVRTLGRGEASEQLAPTEEMLRYDRFFRSLDFGRDAAAEAAAMSARGKAVAQAYVQGVNASFDRDKLPWELRLLGGAFKPWTLADTFLTCKIVAYIGMVQTQVDMERFLVECVQNGVARPLLEELFPGQLAGLDEGLLRKVRLGRRLIPETLSWASVLPRLAASNNWAVAGWRTRSGQPIFCNDPHVEANRLPPLWHEAVLRWRHQDRDRYALGATLPGVPGMILGRTPDVAWGVTYAFMDSVDSWVEECRDGQYRRADGWDPFVVRQELIPRRRKPPVRLQFYENHHGLLDGDPTVPGFYLATRWAGAEGTAASSLEAVINILEAPTVEAGRVALAGLNNGAWNWVLADRQGNIGYQMSGRMPRRAAGCSGLVPLPGWEPKNDWQGFVPFQDLPRSLNPLEGFVVTANDDLNALGTAKPISLPMAPYRAQRIRSLLAQGSRFTVEEMKQIQFDLYSPQAAHFMELLRPLLPQFAARHPKPVDLLSGWNGVYDSDSAAAGLFEQVYRALIEEVFGNNRVGGWGAAVLERLRDHTPIFNAFYGHFDRILLSERSAWFGGRTREAILQSALAKSLSVPAQPYGQGRKIRLKHLVLGGKLPLLCGFDRQCELPGSRATVHQGQIFRASGRELAVGPSFRLITDLATDEIHTTLLGGNSDRRFSPWYANQIQDWLAGRYKRVRGWRC